MADAGRIVPLNRGEYEAQREYEQTDIVTSGYDVYMCIYPCKNKPLTDEKYWKQLINGKYATDGKGFADNAEASAKKAQSYAVGGTSSRSGEDTDNAKYYSTQAKKSADTSSAKAKESQSYAVGGTSSRTGEDTDNAKYYNTESKKDSTSAKSYAVGGTGTRAGEDTDNAKYYYEQAKTITGGNAPDGTTIVGKDGKISVNLDDTTLKVIGSKVGVNVDGTTIKYDTTKKALVAKSGHDLIDTKTAFDALTAKTDKVVEAYLLKSLLEKRADKLVYDEDNSLLKLQSGDTVLSSVEISGTPTTATITITTKEITWKGSTSVLVEVVDGSTTHQLHFDSSGSCSQKVKTLGSHAIKVTDGGKVYETSVDVSAFGGTYSVEIAKDTELTLTVYSAVEDTVYYYPDNDTSKSPITLCTTDSTGKATNVKLTISGGGQQITFYSTVAKDTTNATTNYTKNVNLSDSSTELYLMPDKAIYWYGYEPYLWETGTITHSGYTYKNGTKNKNNLYINVDSSEKYISRGWITQDKVDLSSANNIKGYVTTNGATNAFEFYLLSAKNLEPSSRIKSLLVSDTAKLFDIDVSSLSSSLYPECECGNSGTGSTRQGYLWALWVE